MANTRLLLLLVTILATLLARVRSQATNPIKGFNPRDAADVCFRPNPSTNQVVLFVADEKNLCWYWECGRVGRGRRRRTVLRARNCALNTAVSTFYTLGRSNPCSKIIKPNGEQKFDCTRKMLNEETPPCFDEFRRTGVCKNGATIEVEGETCWCKCPEGFGDFDCSRRVSDLVRIAQSLPQTDSSDDPCPGGVPRRNWCREAGNPCQNNGQCQNQCLSYVCQCIPPFTAGKNCEQFNCTADTECMNGGTCSRGSNDLEQFASCQCLPGFTGVMCEVVSS